MIIDLLIQCASISLLFPTACNKHFIDVEGDGLDYNKLLGQKSAFASSALYLACHRHSLSAQSVSTFIS